MDFGSAGLCLRSTVYEHPASRIDRTCDLRPDWYSRRPVGGPASTWQKGESPRESPGALAVSSDDERGSGALQVVADVLEDLAHNRAEEDEGQEQPVLDERLAILILAAEVGKKSADELNHASQYLLSLEIDESTVYGASGE